MDLEGLPEHVYPGDARHSLVDEHQGDRRVLQRERAECVDCLLPTTGPDDPVVRCISGSQIALHRLDDFGFVVDRDDDGLGLCHRATTASGKQYFQVSPGSAERITGWSSR